MAYDSDKTHSELIEERDYYKRVAETLVSNYKQLVMTVHRHQDEAAVVLDSLGTR